MTIGCGLRRFFNISDNFSAVLIEGETGANNFLRRLEVSLPVTVKDSTVFFFASPISMMQKYIDLLFQCIYIYHLIYD